MRDLEFRFNVLIWTGMGFLNLFLTVVFVELVFGQVNSIAGWSKDQVLLLVVIQAIFTSFLWFFILPNLNSFSRYIRRGELDFVLLKPMNPRFFVSTRYLSFNNFARIFACAFIVFILLSRLGVQPTVFAWLLFLALFFLGIFIFYSLFFLMIVTNFWLINVFNFQSLFDQITETGRLPVYIFQGGLRLFFIYIVPVGFIATFPTQALLGQVGLEKLWLALFLAATIFLLSEWFWRFALKHYQSASS